MYELVESRLRHLVADRLGVNRHELTREVSLLDDLAADSLDLVDIALCLESTLDVEVPETALADVRTFGQLVDMTLGLLRRQRVQLRRSDAPPAMRARILPPGSDACVMERAGALTPYTVQTLADDALRLGRNARLEVVVDRHAADVEVALVHEQFAALASRGIDVVIRRDLSADLYGMTRA